MAHVRFLKISKADWTSAALDVLGPEPRLYARAAGVVPDTTFEVFEAIMQAGPWGSPMTQIAEHDDAYVCPTHKFVFK